MKIDVIILAAGKGTRMHSDKPKVLHEIGGKAMVQHVIDSVRPLGDVAVQVVIGHGAEQVRDTVTGSDVDFVMQEEQLGTGHAVAQALPGLRDDALCLVLYGDVPLTRTDTLERLLAATPSGSMSVLTVTLPDATGYGRMLRNDSGDIVAIVEQKDASPDQLAINEINTGIMAVYQPQLAEWLPALSNDNAQGEYYLTDIIGMASDGGIKVQSSQPATASEVEGVNNKLQLAALERVYQQQRAEQLMLAGATLADPARVDIRGEVSVGKDVFIDINCVLSGNVELGDGVSIEPNCVIENAKLGDAVTVHANSVIQDAEMKSGASLGPFGRLRPGAMLDEGAKVGNFVEVKKATLGKGSKANHLAYIGDAEIGAGCNIGAGTITCNYDGANKYLTQMGDNVFIGSNSTLVAPVSLATDSFVGAGSTVTLDTEAGDLAVGRGKQRNIKGWNRPKKQTK